MVQRTQVMKWGVALAFPAALVTVVGLRALDVDLTPMVPQDVHVTIETVVALTTLLAAFLLLGRLRRTSQMSDVLLAVGLIAWAGAGVLAWSLQIYAFGGPSWNLAVWELASLNLFTGVIVAVGAAVPARRVTSRESVALSVAVIAALALTVALVRLGVRAGWLVSAAAIPDAGGTVIGPSSGIRLTEVAAATAFAVAAACFARRGVRGPDAFLLWWGCFATASAASLLSAAVTPYNSSEGLYVSDAFRFVAAVLLLLGALHEISRSWRRSAAEGIATERRRLAYQLHDGVAQEAAFVASTCRALASELTRPELLEVALAAERALDETRGVIDTLTAPVQRRLDDMIVAVAEQVAHRAGARVHASCDGEVTVDPEVAQALARIVHEAVTNAVQHGGADRIELELSDGDRLRLAIRDNGVGFDPETTGGFGHYGLASMRDRADRIGALLRIRSQADGGIEVEVTL